MLGITSSDVAVAGFADIDVGAAAADILRELGPELDRDDVGASHILGRAGTLIAQKTNSDKARAQLMALVQQQIAKKLDLTRQQAAAAQQGRSAMGDIAAANQLMPLDSGQAELAIDTTASFVIEFSDEWLFCDFAITEEVANSFVATKLKVGGVDWIGMGASVTGNGAGAGMSLAMFTPQFFGRRPVPFIGRKYGSNAKFELDVVATQATKRFSAVLAYRTAILSRTGRC
jgi:hypothetical protein